MASEIAVQDLLEEWGLENYKSAFESNCIQTSELVTLLEPEWKDTLQSLIPVAGHRIKFVKHVKEFIEVAKSDSNEENKIGRYSVRDETISFSSDEPSTSDLSLLSDVPKQQKILKNTSSIKRITKCKVFNAVLDESTSDLSLSSDVPKQQKILLQENTSSRKRSAEYNEPNAILGEQLRLLLSKSASGKCILQLAKQRPYLNHDKDRNKLSDIIIEDELSKSDKISSERFAEIGRAIQYIFPEEDSELYFIPYRNQAGKKLLAKGKLISKYYSIRKEFKTLGVLTQTKNQSDSEEDFEVNDTLQAKLKFLEENTDPWPIVVEYWTDTSKYRVTELHAKSRAANRNKGSDKGKASAKGKLKNSKIRQEQNELENISTYMNKYPALRMQYGYTLLQIDFDLLYSEQKLKAYTSFGNFCNRVIQALNNEENKCEALKNALLFLSEDEIPEETKNLVVLLSLCYLDSVVTVVRQPVNKKTWRPSLSEIQEGVISHIHSIGNLQPFIERRQEKLINWGLTVQPYVVACGPTIEEINTYYVIVDSQTKFSCHCPVKALDICFKIIHAAHLEYSAESYRLWRLIQKEVYDLTTVFDDWKCDAQLPKLFHKFSRK